MLAFPASEAKPCGQGTVRSSFPSTGTRPGPDPPPTCQLSSISVHSQSQGTRHSLRVVASSPTSLVVYYTINPVSTWPLTSDSAMRPESLAVLRTAARDSYWRRGQKQGRGQDSVHPLLPRGPSFHQRTRDHCLSLLALAQQHCTCLCLHPPVTVRTLGAAPSRLMLGIQQDFLHVTIINRN